MTNRLFRLLKLVSIAFTLALGACSGGSDFTSPTPVPDVLVSMVRNVEVEAFTGNVRDFDDDATKVLIDVINAGIRVSAAKCAYLFPPIELVTSGTPRYLLVIDVSDQDVEKMKAFKFRFFTPYDLAGRLRTAICQ